MVIWLGMMMLSMWLLIMFTYDDVLDMVIND